jgi:hypothetical protein
MRIVQRTSGAEALRVGLEGEVHRTAGFSRIEHPAMNLAAWTVAGGWPANYELNISLPLTNGASASGRGGFGGRGGFAQRQYVAVWIEDAAGNLVRVLVFLANKPRYYNELSNFVNIIGRNQNRLASLARATRPAGNYRFVWDGLDDRQKPVPTGTYKIVIETNQEHGSYGKQAGTIECGEKPATLTLPATANFEAVTIQFGPKPKEA